MHIKVVLYFLSGTSSYIVLFDNICWDLLDPLQKADVCGQIFLQYVYSTHNCSSFIWKCIWRNKAPSRVTFFVLDDSFKEDFNSR
jgi:hypothetical protein